MHIYAYTLVERIHNITGFLDTVKVIWYFFIIKPSTIQNYCI